MKQAIQWVLTAMVVLLIIDFIGMVAWAMSGQIPPHEFFLGSTSRAILQAIFF